MEDLPTSELRERARSKRIPMYSVMDRLELLSALSDQPGSIGWRWKHIKKHLKESEHKNVMRLLLGPVRDLDKYPKVVRYLRKHSVQTTMTTSPERLKKVEAVLATLDTSYLDHINIVLPHRYGREKKPYNKADVKRIAAFPKVRIIRTEKDYGPITKMLPVLRKVRDRKAIIISIDDDVGYPMGMINEFIYQKIEKHPKAIIESTEGLEPREHIKNFKTVWPAPTKPRHPYADLVEGWMGVAYTKNLVNTKTMEEISNFSKECYLSDDIVISYVLADNNVPVVRLTDNKYTEHPVSYLYGTGNDALMRGGGTGNVVNVGHLSDDFNLQKYQICLDTIFRKDDPDFVELPKEDKEALAKSKKLPVRKLSDDEKAYIKRHKVYITLTSDPVRVKYLPIMLGNLDLSNVHQVHVNLPEKYRNTTPYDPNDIKMLEAFSKKVKVFRPAKDKGPMTKMLPTLKRIEDKDAIVISIDDDIVYPKGMVNEHIHQCIKHMDEILTGNGFDFSVFKKTKKRQGFDVKEMEKWWPSSESPPFPYVDIAEGFASIAYRKRLVDIPQLEKLNAVSTNCKLSDDFTINYSLDSHGVKRRVINNKYLNPDLIHPLAAGEEKGLHTQKAPGTYWDYNTYKYDQCAQDIRNPPPKKSSKKVAKSVRR